MFAEVDNPQVLPFSAPLRFSVFSPHGNEQQQHHKFCSVRVGGKLSFFLIMILVAMICNLANGEVVTVLPSNRHESSRGNYQRLLATSGPYSFAFTGAVQTWYSSLFDQAYFTTHHSLVKVKNPFSDFVA